MEPTTIIGFRVGVAGFNELGQWDTFRSSAIVPYSHKFKSGETVQVPASSVLIPIDGLKTLKDKWLVLTMVQNHKDGEARTHAHTDELTLELTP